MKNVLITGAASGIGKAVSECFLKNDYQVYAIDINKIENTNNLFCFQSDITNEEDLNKVYEYLDLNNVKLDIIINIAGIHKMASLVEDEYDKLKKVIDINLLGTMLVNNVFYKLLNPKGRIIIVTSEVASFDPMPFNGLYNVSKTALDCYSQALRQELNLLGQKVITIRPGAIETPLSSNSLKDIEDLSNNTKLYHKQASKFLKISKKFMGKPMEVNKMGKFIYKKSVKRRPKLVYKKHQNVGLVLLSVLPKSWQCKIIKFLLNK